MWIYSRILLPNRLRGLSSFAVECVENIPEIEKERNNGNGWRVWEAEVEKVRSTTENQSRELWLKLLLYCRQIKHNIIDDVEHESKTMIKYRSNFMIAHSVTPSLFQIGLSWEISKEYSHSQFIWCNETKLAYKCNEVSNKIILIKSL